MDETTSRLLAAGKVLPLMEEFYSIQGEGFHTGKAAWFIRIGGCDVGCRWCDVKESWNASLFPPVATDQIVENVLRSNADSVVVTGGEPMLYNLSYLCDKLHEQGILLFLETSGSQEITGNWDWICLSPKQKTPPLSEIFTRANELKIIIHEESDLLWAESCAEKISEDCHLLLQPEWSVVHDILPAIVDYVKRYPKWKVSLQSHKYMGIP